MTTMTPCSASTMKIGFGDLIEFKEFEEALKRTNNGKNSRLDRMPS